VGVASLVSCVGALPPLRAEDVGRKFRLAVGLGFLNGQGKADSDSANVLTLLDSNFGTVDRYRDPRNDSAVFGALEFKPGYLAAVSAQYAFSSMLLVEVSAGYQRTDLGDIEVQAQFDGVEIPDIERFDFRSFQVEAGEVEKAPVQVSLLARFRPRARLNPYLGGGVGYTFVGFEPSDEFNQLSLNLDASQGQAYSVTSAFFGAEGLAQTGDPVHDLDGAHVDIGGTWTWHGAGGLELSFKRKWVAFLDVRYSFSSRQAEVTFDGGGDLGVAVPNLTDYCANPPGSTPPGGEFGTVCPGSTVGEDALRGRYGPVRLTLGGVIDGGRLAPKEDAPSGTDCTDPAQFINCTFVAEPDGRVDPGFYYVQGGRFSYDAFTMLLGVRYTF
jgi:hypothetical protein